MTPFDRFAARVARSLADETFVRLVLSRPVDGASAAERIDGRRVELKRGPHVSFTRHFAKRDEVENVEVGHVADWLRARVPGEYRNALLGTTVRDWQLHAREDGSATLGGHAPATRVAPPARHDRAKETLLDESTRPWLAALGILDRDGRVRASKAAKHTQIHRYVEILSHLARDCGWAGASDADELSIADMACGKGYLTFGAWHLFRRVLGKRTRVVGVEAREDLVAGANRVARDTGADGLSFVAGTIASADVCRVDALIALHACDTATDDAILRGIDAGARLILVAPCCHKELRPQLGRPEPLEPALRHGLMEQRFAEWATDALRALFLEWAGYETRMIELVDPEHTPRNLLIAAVRRGRGFASLEARERVVRFERFLGIEHQALDSLLARGS